MIYRQKLRHRVGMMCLLLTGGFVSGLSYAGKVTYVYTDPQGNVLAETDAQGNITAQYDYLPYGSPAMAQQPDGPGYTGHVNDPDTGLIYMQARYYDPETGRFLSIDPRTPAPSNVFGFNRYDYANNNPVVNIDPSGQNSIVSYNADGTIRINVPINFSGPAATPQNIATIKSDVATHWTGLYSVSGEITKVSVAVTAVDANTPKQAINNITLLNGPTSDKNTKGASFVGGDHASGEWNMSSSGMRVGEAAHETGHLMGDADYYTNGTDVSGNRVTTALPGYSNNLMAALNSMSIPDSRNMNVILHSPINVVQKSPPPQPPKQPAQ